MKTIDLILKVELNEEPKATQVVASNGNRKYVLGRIMPNDVRMKKIGEEYFQLACYSVVLPSGHKAMFSIPYGGELSSWIADETANATKKVRAEKVAETAGPKF